MPSLTTIRAVAIAAVIALAGVAAKADDFYELQLQTGKIDFAAGRFVQASDEFRIAAFGFLDRPPLLSEALARLALAQSALGQTSLVEQTLGRFVDVEQRFNTYPSSALDAPARSKFQALLLSTISTNTLKSVPSLAKLVKTPVEAAGDLPIKQRIPAYESGFKREPRNVEWPLALMRLYLTTGDQGEVAKWARRVLDLDAKNTEARALLVHADVSKGNCREALSAFAGLSPLDLQTRADLYADQGVCLVENGKFAEAKTAFAKISEKARAQADVKKAMQTIADREARAAAAKEPPAKPGGNTSAPKAAVSAPSKELPAKEPAKSAATTPLKDPPKTASSTPSKEPAKSAASMPAKEPPLSASSTPAKELQSAAITPATDTQAATSRPTGAGMSNPTTPTPPAASQSKGPTSAEVITASRALVQGGKYAEAAKLLRTAVQTDPTNRQLRLSLLEAAVLTRDWRMAGAQFAASQPYLAGEELYMFYSAVALYENGRRDEARPLMERARPRMVSSPMVDYYLEAILGSTD